jgi:hypothetical protein
MNPIRTLALLGCLIALSASAQTTDTPKPSDAIQKASKLLEEPITPTEAMKKPIPLAQFLEIVQQQLPKDGRYMLRIDKAAFGDEYARIAKTPVRLPWGSTTNLRNILTEILSRIKTKIDYRLDPGELVLTTPERAAFTLVYRLHDLVEDSAAGRGNLKSRTTLLQTVVSVMEPAPVGPLQLLNGDVFVVHATGRAHAILANSLQVLRRIADLSVIVHARLYEVDDAFYNKVKNAKRIPIEEQERIFLENKAPKGGSLHSFLDKQKPVLTSEIKVGPSKEAVFLSYHTAIRCLPSPEQIRKGEKDPQLVLEGVSFLGRFHVTPDRRYLRVKFSENAVEVQSLQKVTLLEDLENKIEAETPMMLETARTQDVDIADGGTLLVAVSYRPRTLRDKKHWWVLSVSPRIYMAEEEEAIRRETKAK